VLSYDVVYFSESLTYLFMTLNHFFDADMLCHAVTLTLDLELLQHFGCRVFKFCTKFEQNQVIHS